MNTLYYGDNLDILRRYIDDESVDLVYLDPPFKSNQDYNVLFAEKDGSQSASQIIAFEDTWQWDQAAAAAYHETVERGGSLSESIQGLRKVLGTTDMLAYVSMMAPRLVELRRALKPSGSIYLHCDPTASHYLKILMDSVFGAERFRNDIVWKRAETVKGNFGQGSKFFDRNTDSILFYAKADNQKFFPQFKPYTQEYINGFFKYYEEGTNRRYRLISMTGPGGAAKGNPEYEVMGVRRYWRYSKDKMKELIAAGLVVQTSPGAVPQRKLYLDEGKGVPVQSLWDDIPGLHSQSGERLGYPTQKPLALLQRIIETSSEQGDILLDPFCGCGTSIEAAQTLGRQWIGIDITHLAITLIKHRLKAVFDGKVEYEVIGEPISLPDAEALAQENRFQFQCWALGLVGARPTDPKRGADQGIDGRLYFHDDKPEKTKQIVISVKSGAIPPNHIRELRGVLDREEAAIGLLITLIKPTKPMRAESASAGFYTSPFGNTKHRRIQIITIEELLQGRSIDCPRTDANVTFKKARPVRPPAQKPGTLFPT